MKAAEIDSRLEELRVNLTKSFKKPDDATIPASVAGAQITLALFAGEIALQLAELNEKLEPARLVKAITEIQGEIEKQERELGIKP